ncbi:MAG: TlpA family protein disulfide reductase [Planctomycetia bacterium]
MPLRLRLPSSARAALGASFLCCAVVACSDDAAGGAERADAGAKAGAPAMAPRATSEAEGATPGTAEVPAPECGDGAPQEVEGPVPVSVPLPVSAPEDAAQVEAEWQAAFALKTKGDHQAAAPMFEAFHAAHPAAARAVEARLEAANSWINVGFRARECGKSNASAKAGFERAATHLEWVERQADKALAARARYLLGNARLYDNDLVVAARDYTLVLERHEGQAEWSRRALEKRLEVRRHALDRTGALADLDLYLSRWSGVDKERASHLSRVRAQTTALGQPAKPFASTDWVQGEPRPLESLLGEVVALYFFSTQCSFCDVERDCVAAWATRLAGKVRFVGVLVPQQDKQSGAFTEPLDVARAEVPKKRFDFPVVYDHKLRIALSFLASKPDMVLLDREGRVRWHDSPKNLQPATIELLLAE